MPFGSPFGNVEGITNIPPSQLSTPPPPPPPQQMGVGGMTDSTGRLLLPHEVYMPQPPMSQPPYMGGVQLESKVLFSSTPGIPPPPSHRPSLEKPLPRTNSLTNPLIAKFQREAIQSDPTSAMGGMMIPLLIGGGILLIILIR